MAVSEVGFFHGVGSGSATATTSSTPGDGIAVIVLEIYTGGAGTPSVSDGTNTYQEISGFASINQTNMYAFYAQKANTVSKNVTATITGSGTYVVYVFVWSVKGSNGSGFSLDNSIFSTNGGGSTNSLSLGSLSYSAGDLIVVAANWGSGTASATSPLSADYAPATLGQVAANVAVSSLGSLNPNLTNTISEVCSGYAIAIRAVGSGGGTAGQLPTCGCGS